MSSIRLSAVAVLFMLVISLFAPNIMATGLAAGFHDSLALLEKLGRVLPLNAPVLAVFVVSGELEDFQIFDTAAIEGLYALSQWLGYEPSKTIEEYNTLKQIPLYRTHTFNGVKATSIVILTSYGSVVELTRKLGDRLLALVVKPVPKLEALPFNSQIVKTLLHDNLVLNNYDVRQLIGVSKVEEIYGITGAGIPVAVVDTGVDYGHPDLKPALKYYEGFYNGMRIREPLVLDADEVLKVFFTPIEAVDGYLDTSNKYFRTLTFYMRFAILDSSIIQEIFGCTKFYVGGIPSASGNYMLGFIVELTPQKIYVYPVLMYDPDKPGEYTELRIDFNLNCNFADDKPVSYYGDRVLVYDEDGDGYPEVSLGVAGGFFYDWLGVVSETPAILPGWDLKGRYLSIFYDWDGHGTACASAVAGRGVVVPASVVPEESLLANVVKPQPGMARDAIVVGVSGLLAGTEIGLLWAAGFDIAPDGTIYYSGQPRAKIISNSWGALPIYEITFFNMPARVEGLDFIAVLEDMLATPGLLDPSYPGVLIVQAAGNGGPGYGTVVTPAAAHRILTVGASTSYAYVKDIGDYGAATADDIAFFSARGPTPLGWVKPDVVNVGWASWTAAPIWAGGFDLFGGTSYATPLTAGVAALIYQVLPNADPQLVKQIIMSTADNIGYDVYSMGAGRVNAFKAVSLALELAERESWTKVKPLIAYSVDAEKHYLKKVYQQWVWNAKEAIELVLNIFYTIWGRGKAKLLKFKPYSVEPGMVKQYSLYVPDIEPGGVRETNFTIYNPSSGTAKLSVNVYWEKLVLDREYIITLQPENTNTTYAIAAIPVSMFADIDLLKVVFTVPYKVFDREHDYKPDYWFFMRLYGWRDVNGNGRVDIGELKYAGFSFQLSNQLTLTISKPQSKLGDCDYLIISVTGEAIDRVAEEITGRIRLLGYKINSNADWVSVSPANVVLQPNSLETFKVVVRVPENVAPIAYQAWIVVSYEVDGYRDAIVIPLSFTVYRSVDRLTFLEDDTISPFAKLYSPYTVYGAYNWIWWFEAGDWRYYYVYVDGRRFGALAYTVFWKDKWTCITTYAVDPLGSFGGLGAVSSAIRNWEKRGIFTWMAVVRDNIYSTLTATISLRGHVFSVPSIDGGRVMAGVATIAVHAVLFDGGKSFSRIRLSLLPIIYARSLPDTITAHGVYNEHIVVPYKGFYSSMVVPKVLSLGDVEMLLSLTIPLAISSPSGITEVPLKPVNEIFSEASVVVRAYGSPKPLWIALVVPITDTRFNLVMVYDGETLETYNLVWFEEASLIR